MKKSPNTQIRISRCSGIQKSLIILLFFSFQATAVSLYAQSNDETFNESVTVTGTYKPEIKEFDKMNVEPKISDTSSEMRHKFTYDVTTRRLTSIYSPTRIKAAKIIGEPTSRLYNSYVRLGFGNYWSPLAEIYYNSTRSKKINYGVFATHNSSWGTIGKRKKGVDFPETYYGKNHFSQTGVTAFGKFIVGDKVQLATDLSYENDYNLYYGFNDATLHANDSLAGFTHSTTINYRDSLKVKNYRSLYNRLAWNFGVKDLSTEALGYSANVKVSNLWALYKQNELNLNLDGDVHYAFNVGKKKHKAISYLHLMWDGYYGTVKAKPGMTMPLGYTGTGITSSSAFRNLFDINPYIDFMFGSFKLHTGFLSDIENFSSADTTHFHIYPDVELSKSFLKEALNLSLGAVGGMEANSLDVIRQVNPYVGPYATLRGTSHYDFYLRMRVNFSKKLEMKLYGEFNMFKDDLCFQLDTNYALKNVYEPLYLKYNRVKAGGSFSFVNDEMLNISLGGNYYYYTDKTLPYRPDFDAFFTAKFNYHDKWLFGVEALVVGKMRGSQLAANGSGVETLPLRYGISAELEYRHNRALSFFIKADNLAYQRYYLWSNYPSQRITFLAGVTYTILTKKR